MIEHLPTWIEVLFLITWMITIGFFYFSNGKPKLLTLFIVLWSILHSVLAYSGFYELTTTMPPRFALVLLPTILLIVYGLLPKQRTWIFMHRDIRWSTFLHSVRIPVEIVLLYLFINKMIPELMTFEGRNFDILAGLTAPIIGFLYMRGRLSKRILIIWNIIGLFLVSFILINGVLSAEFPFQQFGFDQPSRALNYFPFVLLPAVIVPIVIYTHISDIIMLRKELREASNEG